MSQEKVEFKSKGYPATKSRSTVIHRTSGNFGTGGIPQFTGGQVMSMSMSSGRHSTGSGFIPTGAVSKISQQNVAAVMDTRNKEKTEMNRLNNRFAGYVEKVRCLETENKCLKEELRRLKGRRTFDLDEIKGLYGGELDQCKKIIDELSEEKAEFDAKITGLEDRLEEAERECDIAKKNEQELRQKMNKLNEEIAGLTGEIKNARLRIESLEDENAKLKDQNKRLTEDVRRLHMDLDEETRKRIAAEMALQSSIECHEHDNKVAEATINELKKMVEDTSSINIDMKSLWKDQMQQTMKDLSDAYQQELCKMQDDMNRNYDMKIQSLQMAKGKEDMTTLQAKEEAKRVKSQLNGIQPRIAQLEEENAALRRQIAKLQEDYEKECKDHDEDNNERDHKIECMAVELEEINREMQTLLDAKLSLELEIAAYRKLLECEEQNMALAFEQSSGSRSQGGQMLADALMSGGGSSSEQQKSTISESANKILVQRTCRGDIAIESATPDGSCVVLKNNTKKDNNPTVDLTGWTIKKFTNDKTTPKYTYTFGDVKLAKGKDIKLFAKGAEENAKGNDIVCTHFTWGLYGSFSLCDNAGQEKATLTIKSSS